MSMSVRVNVVGLAGAIDKIRQLTNSLQRPEPGLLKATNRLAQLWAQNFDSEGGRVGGWADLAPQTQKRRAAANLPADHPILYRYGSLRGVVIDMFQNATGDTSQVRSSPGGDHATVGGSLTISGGTARLHAVGWPVLNQWGDGNRLPARPYWFVNDAAVVSARGGVEEWLGEVIKGLGTGS